MASVLSELDGIAGSIHLEIDGSPSRPRPWARTGRGRGCAGRLPALRAHPSQREAWTEGARVLLRAAHPRYSVSTELSDEQRAAIAADLMPSSPGQRR